MGRRSTRRSGKVREAHPEVLDGVGRPTRRSGRMRKAHLEVLVGLAGPPGGPGGVGRPSRRSERGREAHPRSGSGREADADVRETHMDVREGSKAHPKVREWSRVSPGVPEGVGLPIHGTEIGQEAHPDVQEVSGSPSGGPGGVGRPTRRLGRVVSPTLRWSRRVRDAHLEIREGLEGPP